MATKQSLSELAKALPEQERRRLLARINRSLSLNDQNQRSVYHGTLQEDERERLVHQELDRLSFWDRILYWMKRVSSSRPESETFQAFKLDKLKRRIVSAPKPFVRFDRGTLEPSVAEQIVDLYRATVELAPFFRSIWDDPNRLQWMVTYLLERKIPNARTSVEDFVTLDEMQDMYLRENSKAAIRTAVLSRLDEYLATIPGELFSELEEGVLPVYLLKYVCLYPYRDFFGLFNVSAEAIDEEPEPEFRRTAVVPALALLEQFYFALYSASRLGSDPRIHPELLDAYDAYGESDSVSAKHYNALLSTLEKRARAVQTSLPLAAIIRYFQKDPYYKLMVYLPRLALRDFYGSHLRVMLLTGIDEVFPDVRLGIVRRIQSDIFPKEPPSLDFYRQSLNTLGRKLDAPPFRYFRVLRTLRYFVGTVYRDDIAPTVRLLARIMPVRHREIASDLTLRANGIEDVAERISMFDYGFSPESDEGKAFYRLRYAGEKDISQARAYGTVVAQKNREARDIIDDASDHLNGLEAVFRKLQRLGSRTIVERYESLTHLTRSQKLEDLVARHVTVLTKLRTMASHLVEIESA